MNAATAEKTWTAPPIRPSSIGNIPGNGTCLGSSSGQKDHGAWDLPWIPSKTERPPAPSCAGHTQAVAFENRRAVCDVCGRNITVQIR